jgi:hypothetical protein
VGTNSKIMRYKWHPYTKRRYIFAIAAIVLGAVVWLFLRDEKDWPPRVITLVFAIASIFLLVEQDTEVDMQKRVIIREGRLLGRYLVWRLRDQLSDFTEVCFRRQNDSENGDTVFVGLRRHTGRMMAIQFFLFLKASRVMKPRKLAGTWLKRPDYNFVKK